MRPSLLLCKGPFEAVSSFVPPGAGPIASRPLCSDLSRVGPAAATPSFDPGELFVILPAGPVEAASPFEWCKSTAQATRNGYSAVGIFAEGALLSPPFDAIGQHSMRHGMPRDHVPLGAVAGNTHKLRSSVTTHGAATDWRPRGTNIDPPLVPPRCV